MQQNLLVDYLVMSFKIQPKQDCFFKFLVRILNFPFLDSEKIRSYYGLSDCWYYGGIKIHVNPDLVVLDMSGKGCRTCEELNNGWDWYRFLRIFDAGLTVPIKGSDYGTKGQYAVHISRIDLASDLLGDSRLTVPFLQRCVQQDKFICKSNYYSCVVGNYEMAVYFGSPRSDRRLRIYDKALEQGLQDSTKWVRFEFQLRNDNATSFYLNLSQTCGGDFSKCYYGMLHDYLRFTTGKNFHDHNQCVRLRVSPWWLKFLRGVGRIKQLYLPGNEYDIPAASRIYARQCSSTAKLLMEAADGDVTELMKMAEGASLNKKQREALKKYQDEKEKQAADAHEQALWDEAASRHGAAILETIHHDDPLSRPERLMYWKACEDRRKYKERNEHWQAMSYSAGVIEKRNE